MSEPNLGKFSSVKCANWQKSRKIHLYKFFLRVPIAGYRKFSWSISHNPPIRRKKMGNKTGWSFQERVFIKTSPSWPASFSADVCKPLPGDLPGLVSVLVSLSSSLLLCCAGPKILVLDKALNIEQEVGELFSWFLPLMSSCLAVHQRCHVNNRSRLQP